MIKFRSLGALENQDKSESIHGDVERRLRKTIKDCNTSIDLLFFQTQMLVSMPSTSTRCNLSFFSSNNNMATKRTT
jgi:hypothetical protein